MKKRLISINDLPPDGKQFELDDQEIWEEPIKEFKMEYKIVSPLHARVFVQPMDEGVLVKGEIKGKVSVPCNRCAEDAYYDIDSDFSEYEEIPAESGAKDDSREGAIVYQMHAPMLDLDEVCWEQFMLALPAQPLCKEDCKGLCPQCGANLNAESCGCASEAGDPRMAALRGVTVAKK